MRAMQGVVLAICVFGCARTRLTIEWIRPDVGWVGTVVKIRGTGFADRPADNVGEREAAPRTHLGPVGAPGMGAARDDGATLT